MKDDIYQVKKDAILVPFSFIGMVYGALVAVID